MPRRGHYDVIQHTDVQRLRGVDQAAMAGEHILRSFRNADLRHRLRDTGHLGADRDDPRRSSAKVFLHASPRVHHVPDLDLPLSPSENVSQKASSAP